MITSLFFRLKQIIETVLFCARQIIKFPGYRDYGNLLLTKPQENDGNFRAALRLRINSGKNDLQNHKKFE